MTAPTWLRMIAPSPTPIAPPQCGRGECPEHEQQDVAAPEDERYAAARQDRVANTEARALTDDTEYQSS